MADRSTVVQVLADQIGKTRKTIWNICRRYEEMGVAAVFDAPRSGRPRQISPPATRAGGATRVL
ncbi:MAG: helix-turn-helix domain-containing protein [Polyangiaceae bacterium]|nr:helix-turn-helix domain-containing protein [Polyangiaceae bacterium]